MLSPVADSEPEGRQEDAKPRREGEDAAWVERSPAAGVQSSRAFSIRGHLLIVLGLVAYALLNLGDLITTRVGLTMGLREGNPLMSRLLHAYGFDALIFYKVLVVAFVTVGVCYLMRRHLRIAALTLLLCSLLVGSAVVLNLVQFLRFY